MIRWRAIQKSYHPSEGGSRASSEGSPISKQPLITPEWFNQNLGPTHGPLERADSEKKGPHNKARAQWDDYYSDFQGEERGAENLKNDHKGPNHYQGGPAGTN